MKKEESAEVTLQKGLYDVVKQMTIIGRGGCGKTSILRRFIYHEIVTETPATPIESESIEYLIAGKRVNLRIFDTNGQDDCSRFRALTLPVSDYILICFSVDNASSYSEVLDTIHFLVHDKKPKGAKVLLCGTKIDTRCEISITTEEGESLQREINAAKYFECSAATGEGIDRIFEYIKNDIYVTEIKPTEPPCGFLWYCR